MEGARVSAIPCRVTGQLTDTPTRGLPTRGLDDSRTGQLADATGDFACLVFVLLAACQTASCPVSELAYPLVVQLPLVAGCLLAVIVLMWSGTEDSGLSMEVLAVIFAKIFESHSAAHNIVIC